MSQLNFDVSFAKTYHKSPYPAIDPTKPSLSASGKAVLITAGHTGIGYAIAQNFAVAGATDIILLARRRGLLQQAADSLSRAYPSTKFHQFAASIDDLAGVRQAFLDIKAIVPYIDILATSAAYLARMSNVLEVPAEELRQSFETNVLGNINLIKEFLADMSKNGLGKEKIILDISSQAAHLDSPMYGTYGTTKTALSRWLEHLCRELEGDNVRIHSFHPGNYFTEAVKNFGIKEDVIAWDDVQLAGQFSVWLASKEAAFLNGRLVWANWDVEELKAQEDRFKADSHFLTLGLLTN